MIKLTLRQMEWPQTRVSGSCKYSKQERQEREVSMLSMLFFILAMASKMPFFMPYIFSVSFWAVSASA